MDPSRNAALQNAKLQALLSSASRSESETSSDMASPPAYETVVDPSLPIPNVANPYQQEEEEDNEDNDTPEITINAATQVRGHGNIISIAQLDSARIANLVAVMLNGGNLSGAANSPAAEAETGATPSTPNAARNQRPHLTVNITVNCGATVIGDRNIVGPGLGDIARQMQAANREKAARQQQAQQGPTDQKAATPTSQQETRDQTQATAASEHGGMSHAHTLTPPMSRSSSQSGASAGAKRKAEVEDEEVAMKKQC